VRAAVRAFAEGRYDDVAKLVSGLIALDQATFAQNAIEVTPDSKAILAVRDAGFGSTPDEFKLVVFVQVVPAEHERLPPKLWLSLRFNLKAPRPFDISYVAYGRSLAARPYLEMTDFGSAN
jgi:hypothetical protein